MIAAIKIQKELEKQIKLDKIVFADISCRHCKTFLINPESLKFLMILDHFFSRCGKIPINSLYRCPEHHLAVKKKELGRNLTEKEKADALQSGHVQLIAADLYTARPVDAFNKAMAFGEFNGIGVYPWGIHVDLKPRRSFWASKNGQYKYFSNPIETIKFFQALG